MDNVIIPLVSIIAGVLGTLIVSKYYFQRSIAKSLTPYLQFYTSIFKNVDEELRKELKIEYQGISVDELFSIQYLIANTGEKAIRDIIRPLRLIVPAKCSVLDASILHISPNGRDVKATIIKSINEDDKIDKIDFSFPLLNRDDYFIVKILIKGNPDIKDFRFTITADDLLPELEIKRLPSEIVESSDKREFELSMLIVGFIFLLFGSSITQLFYSAWIISKKYSVDGIGSFLPVFSFNSIAIYLSPIMGILLIIGGVVMMVGSVTNFSIPKRHRFIIPENLQKFQQGYLYFDEKHFQK